MPKHQLPEGLTLWPWGGGVGDTHPGGHTCCRRRTRLKTQVEGRASCGCVLASRLRSERAQPRGLGLTAKFPSREGHRPAASSTLRILMGGVTWPQDVHGSTQAGRRGQCWKPRMAQTRVPWEYGGTRPYFLRSGRGDRRWAQREKAPRAWQL